MTRKALLLTALLGLATPALAAGTITVATSADAPTLDPNATFNGYSFAVTNQIFETLLRRTDDGIQPGLATSWKALSPTRWRFELRRGVRFQDGTPFNAEAVKYSIERLIDPANKAPGAYVLDVVKDVKVVDADTVEITTRYPFGPLLAHLTHPVTAIVSPTAAKKAGKNFGRSPVGTGPFAFDAWKTGDQVTLVANKNYWNGAPKLDKIVFRTIPETATQVVELRSGAVDLIVNLPPERVKELENNPRIDVAKSLGWGSTYFGFNTQSGPTRLPKVRQALAAAIDRDAIVNQLRGGMAVKASVPVPPTVWGAAKGVASPEYDVAKAKRLLAEAGYKNGFSIDLISTNTGEFPQLAQAIQFQLGQIGVKVNVKLLEYSAFVQEVVKPNHGLYLSSWGTVTLDADYALYALFHSSEIGTNNYALYKNPKVDKLLLQARRSNDSAERQKAYLEVQKQIASDLPLLTLYYPYTSYAKSSRLQGVEVNYSWINMNLSKAFIK
ncbi:peptide/nickel transport system substrate-binding protein [Deinobacterium chartae]|uniref:Peptide/nickel transport system substrate-binding protein n=1 Tax=Deinobacterium chartae TaxID=521158 RepID=A0A841HV93_9DEIO|nr:glutathione ABC transporter substrate-binding protein [Deinobacterium chartae]MBB6097297.1 peptide/nickel transport system substrate-binding protein [Deinobacterium chartae]